MTASVKHVLSFRSRTIALFLLVLLLLTAARSASHALAVTPASDPVPTGAEPQATVYLPLVITEKGPVDMIVIPAGAFQMGCSSSASFCDTNEPPITGVTLSRFSIDKYEVTWARYTECVTTGPCTAPSTETPDNLELPVYFVSQVQASTFCTWDGKRLPTEAEWEKAARGTDGRVYPWGAATATCDLANHTSDTTGFACESGGSPVGSYPDGASPFGVMDLAGNVSEWTSTTGEFPGGLGTGYVVKGGNYMSFPSHLRSSARGLGAASTAVGITGFRCVLP